MHTVNGHMKSIYFKLNVKSRGEAQHIFNKYISMNSDKLLILQGEEKAERAAELVIANIELDYQNQEKAKRVDELEIANAEKAERKFL